MTTRLVLIRHGETDWNVEGRYQGQADPPLNQTGVSQAEDLARKLVGAGLTVIYSSPLARAYQTAEIISGHLHVPLQVDPRLMEIHQGDWQTRLRSEIESLYPVLFNRWETEPWEVTPPQGEHLMEVQQRVLAALEEIVTLHTRETLGIVSHRIPLAMIKLQYQGLQRDSIRTLMLPNTHFEEIMIGS